MSFGESCVAISSTYLFTQILDILLSQRAKLTARDKEGCTALHKAVEYQNQEAVKFLLSEL